MAVKKQKKEEVRVSFLPEKEEWRFAALYQKKSLLIIVLLIITLITAGVAGYLRFSTSRLNTLYQTRQKEMASSIAQLRELEAKAAATGNVGQLIELAKDKLKQHNAGERVLDALENSVIPEVMLTELAADAKGVLVFKARGKDFEAVTRQLMVWKENTAIKNVQVTEVSTVLSELGSIEGVDFGVTLTLADDLLNWQP